MNGRDVRLAARSGALARPTAGLAPGFVQGNLVIVPNGVAAAFARFCEQNPKPCAVIGTTEPGAPNVPTLGGDIDLRTDIPRYRVWRDGELAEEVPDITQLWRDDLVGFVLGCSFTFESALLAAGVPVRHIEQGVNVPMYRTNVPCRAAGRFSGLPQEAEFAAAGREFKINYFGGTGNDVVLIVVPEPSTLTLLLAVGLGALIARRKPPGKSKRRMDL